MHTLGLQNRWLLERDLHDWSGCLCETDFDPRCWACEHGWLEDCTLLAEKVSVDLERRMVSYRIDEEGWGIVKVHLLSQIFSHSPTKCLYLTDELVSSFN